MVSKKNIINTIAIIVVIYLFISLNPFVLWMIWPGFINFPLFFAIVLSSLILINIGFFELTKSKVFFAIPIFILMLHLGTPLLGGIDFDIGKIMSFTSLLLILFYKSSVHAKIFEYFKKAILFISWYAIVVFVITFIGVDLPYYTIPGQTLVMQNSFGGESFYKLYGLVVSSTNTVYNIAGFNVARICGPFQEPGHFAIYLGLVSFFQKLIYKKISLGFIIAGILTLSPNYFLLLGIAIIYEFLFSKDRGSSYLYVFIGCVVSIFLLFLSPVFRDEIYFLLIGRNFDTTGVNITELLDDRAGKQTLAFYYEFIKTPYVYYGRGIEFMSQYGVLSDWRGMILKYGIIGLVFSLLASYRILFFTDRIGVKLFLSIILAIIFLQRSWMFESTFVYIYIIIGLISYKYSVNVNKY